MTLGKTNTSQAACFMRIFILFLFVCLLDFLITLKFEQIQIFSKLCKWDVIVQGCQILGGGFNELQNLLFRLTVSMS